MTVEICVPRIQETSPAAAAPTDDVPVDFERSLAELEALVESLEHGDLPLDEALKSFERGVALTRQCQGALKAAQQKVEILLHGNGNAEPEPFTEGPDSAINPAD
jgi:exodeoxyribonuclease VII small subunit